MLLTCRSDHPDFRWWLLTFTAVALLPQQLLQQRVQPYRCTQASSCFSLCNFRTHGSGTQVSAQSTRSPLVGFRISFRLNRTCTRGPDDVVLGYRLYWRYNIITCAYCVDTHDSHSNCFTERISLLLEPNNILQYSNRPTSGMCVSYL